MAPKNPIIFLTILLITIIINCTTITASPSLSTLPSLPQSPQATPPQFNNIIDALIEAGDFGNWVNIITGATKPLVLPPTATLFIPEDDALNRLPESTDPLVLVFPYHVVPNERLSFAELQLLKPNCRLPTLLPNKSILVTNTSRSNFTLDCSPLTRPDLYVSSTVAVHGIGAILDYSVYGDDDRPKTNRRFSFPTTIIIFLIVALIFSFLSPSCPSPPAPPSRH